MPLALHRNDGGRTIEITDGTTIGREDVLDKRMSRVQATLHSTDQVERLGAARISIVRSSGQCESLAKGQRSNLGVGDLLQMLVHDEGAVEDVCIASWRVVESKNEPAAKRARCDEAAGSLEAAAPADEDEPDPLIKKSASMTLPSGAREMRGVKVPPEWSVHGGSLLVRAFGSPAPSTKIAAFDFDGCTHQPLQTALSCILHRRVHAGRLLPCTHHEQCAMIAVCAMRAGLADTPLGGNDPKAWKMQFPHVPRVLAELHASGSAIIIVTNESMDRFKKPEAIRAAILKKTGRLEGFAAAAGVPLLALCATAKDTFRKPGTGAYDFVVQHTNRGVTVDRAASFFVGDAAGRPRDHSDCDRAFAAAAGLPFHDEKEFFERMHP